MNSNMIACFLEAARSKGFSRAAAKLYFTQQTVSKQVAALEKELGVALFLRSGSGLTLTKAGQYYFTLFQNSLYNRELVRQRIRVHDELHSGDIRIGCSEWIDPYREIYPAILKFREEAPEIRISFSLFRNEQLLKEMREGALDIAIFSEAHLPEQTFFRAEPLCRENICVVGPAGIVGPGLSREEREKRRSLSFLIVPAWERGYIETKVFSRQEIRNLDIPTERIHFVSNLDSLVAMMRQLHYLAFTDARFGVFAGLEGLGYEPIGMESFLQVCTLPPSDNGNVEKLIRHLKNSLAP